MTKIRKIVFVHSLNNFTGSANILSVIIKSFVKKGYSVELITSRGEGFLSNMNGVKYKYTGYRWANNRWQTAVLLLISQIHVFLSVCFLRNKGCLYYLNTITTIGAAWACRLTNKRFVYHVHENMYQNKPIYHIFRWTYRCCNRKSIFVSSYLKSTAVNCMDGMVVYNGLDHSFLEEARRYLSCSKSIGRNILMVSGLRRFKGVYEFVALARKMPEYSFELVLSEKEETVKSFILEISPSFNIRIFSQQDNMHLFYRRAGILLQLSHPDKCVETFGLTILEAMVYGIPAIVPDVGGPTELIDNGENGFLLNPLDIEAVIEKIKWLMGNDARYNQFSERAIQKSVQFSEKSMIDGIEEYLDLSKYK